MSKLATQSTAHRQAIVVGSGLAGLSAASQLISHGVAVHLLERSVKPGGNSIKASSGINGAPTKYQPGTPLFDTRFYEDTIKSVGGVISTARKEREDLISTLTNSSSDAISWLVDEKWIDLSVVVQLGGHSFPRTHRGAGKTPPGASIVTTLLKSLKEHPLFYLETSCLVTSVLKSGDEVTGVEYDCEGQTKLLHGPVIFASGGFGGDAEGMLAQYRPDLAGFPSTNDPRPGSQNLLTDVGAQLRDMEFVQVHPTSFVDPKDARNPVKFLAAELLRGEGGLLLHDGKRFINEMETRKNVTEAITRFPATDSSPRQWDIQLVLDEGIYEKATSHIDFYVWKGLMHKTTIEELGPTALSTIQEYAKAAAGHVPDPLGRNYFAQWKLSDVSSESVVYVGKITPAVHFTMGGVVISPRGEVLDANNRPIKGLWAAGEVSGGIHGENRLGGSSLLECVVFGRISGDQAFDYLKEVKQ
ncbi:Flavocytochrome c [Venustampulla echinocandica]|uniref:Fumarate reductase n=1 Tax=Venustampulla echinocandica TaxID=2656787 RepID=A0A370TCN1_9HELO|nr:Flavocytochrome c [Venustampulla echinocandica]RDL32012.1 Flavocytochrome c [Venustampulla echinocandica]